MAKTNKIRIKLIGNYRTHIWIRQFPQHLPVWGNCEFIFDAAVRDYDWLVVYNDFPGALKEEKLSCHRSRTLLVTTEPATIKSYGLAYTRQFGHVLTSQPEWALPHTGRIFSQPALQWFYGLGSENCLTYDQMVANPPLEKSKDIATVCSIKQQKHTLHNQRYKFTQKLKENIPELDIYGHGVRPMVDKADALDAYRYHIAIENFSGPHHWTEKLSDPFLGATLPFYYGCTNVFDYFPEKSLITIDIDDADGASEIILRAIRDKEYEKRLPHILEARRLVLEKFNLFAALSQVAEQYHDETAQGDFKGAILSRRQLRSKRPLVAVEDFFEKCRLRLLNSLKK